MKQTENKQGKGSRWRRWLVELGLVMLVIVAVQWWQTRDGPSGPAPALRGQLLNGERVVLSDLRGRPVLVHFWATWCPLCRLEEDSIQAIAQDHAVLTIATTSGDAAEVQAYLDENGLNFPVLLDESGEIGRQWGVRGVPTSYVLDAEGNTAHATVGYSTGWGLRLRLWLAGL